MIAVAAASLVAAAIVWAALRIGGELRAMREANASDRAASLLQLFAPAIAAARLDPRAYLVWQPVAITARRLFPDACAALERASGGPFPFAPADIQAAHAQWTTDW